MNKKSVFQLNQRAKIKKICIKTDALCLIYICVPYNILIRQTN